MIAEGGTGYVTIHPGGAEEVIGVLRKTIASTDSDYAENTNVPIEVPLEPWVEWEFSTASLVAADVTNYVDIDTTDPGKVDRSTSADDIVFVTKRISATKGVGVISKLAPYRGD